MTQNQINKSAEFFTQTLKPSQYTETEPRAFIAANCKKPNTQLLLFENINDVEQFGFIKEVVHKCLKGRQAMHKYYKFEYATPSELKYYLKVAEHSKIIKIIKHERDE